MHQDPPATCDGSIPNPEDDNEDEGTQTPSNTRNSPDTVAAFAVNTARNLQLAAADGEKSLLQSSQVFFFFSRLVTLTTFTCLEIDAR